MRSFTESSMERGWICQTEVAAVGLQEVRYKNHGTK